MQDDEKAKSIIFAAAFLKIRSESSFGEATEVEYLLR